MKGVASASGLEADFAAGWIGGWGGQLLHEEVHAGLDLLDVALGAVHPAFERGDALHFVEFVQEHLPERLRRPLAEAGSLHRLDAVSDGNDDVEVVDSNLLDLCFAGDRTVSPMFFPGIFTPSLKRLLSGTMLSIPLKRTHSNSIFSDCFRSFSNHLNQIRWLYTRAKQQLRDCLAASSRMSFSSFFSNVSDAFSL